MARAAALAVVASATRMGVEPMRTSPLSPQARVDQQTEAGLEVTVLAEASPARLVARGVIDPTTVGRLRVALEQAVRTHGRILVDLTEVSSIGPEGIRVLYHHGDDLSGVVVAAQSLLHKALLVASRFPVLVAPARPGEHRSTCWQGARRRSGKPSNEQFLPRVVPLRRTQGPRAPSSPPIPSGRTSPARPLPRREPLAG
jgi:hypothetical protein